MIVTGRADGPRFDILRRLGFPDCVDVADGPVAEQVLALTGGRPVDVVLEATGHPPSITGALPLLRRGGVLVVAGIHAAPLSLPLTAFVRSRHQLRASHSSEPRTWERVAALVARDPEGFRPMITHRLPLARAGRLLALAPARSQQGDPHPMSAVACSDLAAREPVCPTADDGTTGSENRHRMGNAVMCGRTKSFPETDRFAPPAWARVIRPPNVLRRDPYAPYRQWLGETR